MHSIRNAGGPLRAERYNILHLALIEIMHAHLIAGACEIGSHRIAHVSEADETQSWLAHAFNDPE
jgi:hypothetical protein